MLHRDFTEAEQAANERIAANHDPIMRYSRELNDRLQVVCLLFGVLVSICAVAM